MPTKLTANTGKVHIDSAECKIVIPVKVEGNVDWRWFNLLHEAIRRHNTAAKRDADGEPIYTKCTSGEVMLAFPNNDDFLVTPELVLAQEALLQELATGADAIFASMQQTQEQDRAAKQKAKQEALQAIRNMQR